MEFEHELAQNKEQYEGYTVFQIEVKGSDKPIKMMCLSDVKQIISVLETLEGNADNSKKLKELERQLTLIRDDFIGYCNFMERNIRQSKEIVAWEDSFRDLIETLETLDYVANTDKEADGLKQKLINIVKGIKPNSRHDQGHRYP